MNSCSMSPLLFFIFLTSTCTFYKVGNISDAIRIECKESKSTNDNGNATPK